MKLPRRQFLRLAAGAVALPAMSRITAAQSYPTRPVHLVVGYPPGGAPDIVSRLIAEWLSERLGQQFIVDNRAGAGSNIGTEIVAKAPPDGYMLFMAVSTNASTQRCTQTSISVSSTISRRSQALAAHPSSWWLPHRFRQK